MYLMASQANCNPGRTPQRITAQPRNWKLARYVFECMEHRHRRESGRVIVSSEESFGSSSDDDSILWTEEFDEDGVGGTLFL